jgi:DNA-binding response OmpR family regulator
VPTPETPPRKRILVVEDDPTSLGALRQILQQREYDVVAVASGEEALPLVESSSFDLFILDVVMSGMSGFDLCRRIRENPRSSDTPVIFLTGKERLLDMAEGDDAGSDLYLVKPVLAVKLLKMVGLFLTPDGPLSRRRSTPPQS